MELEPSSALHPQLGAPTRAEVFNTCRPRLFGIAYRMLGSRAEAEDILQDAYVRWHEGAAGTARMAARAGLNAGAGATTNLPTQAQASAPANTSLDASAAANAAASAETAGEGHAESGPEARAEIRSPEAWLITIVTRLAIDRLRALKTEREHYPGFWLPEPLVTSEPATPEGMLEFSGDVSTAFLVVLERLGAEERAAFLLREVFDVDYPEIARVLGKSEAACRQTVHRAKGRVRQARPRFEVSRAEHRRLLERFVVAARGGDRQQLMALFAADARFTGDGGGKAVSVTRVLEGADRLARFFHVIARQYGPDLTFQIVEINGVPGLLRFHQGKLDSAHTVVTDGQRIIDIYSVRNPDKLAGIMLSQA